MSNIYLLELLNYCKLQPDGKFMHPTLCGSFVECKGQKPTVQQCPTGLLFNPVVKKCERNEKIVCLKSIGKISYGARSSGKLPSGVPDGRHSY